MHATSAQADSQTSPLTNAPAGETFHKLALDGYKRALILCTSRIFYAIIIFSLLTISLKGLPCMRVHCFRVSVQ